MGRLLWPIALAIAFFLGWAGGSASRPARPVTPAADESETTARLQQQVDALQARLRAGDDATAARRQPRMTADTAITPIAGAERRATREGRAASEPSAPATAHVAAPSAARVTPAPAADLNAALDRFARYLEAMNGPGGAERWRHARELIDELRAMGPAAGQALMHVLQAGADSEERRAAARLIGQLQIGAALPVLKDVIERDTDLLLRRAAAAALRRLQTPESIPVMERMLAHPAEDRFVRLSAAVGLAESGRPQGVAGLAHIFEEANADGRGRDIAFRALAGLKDERSLPFMRQVAASQAEPAYRLQAIRYLSAQGDQQALATLQGLMHAPNEQPSIRDAAAQAYTALGGT